MTVQINNSECSTISEKTHRAREGPKCLPRRYPSSLSIDAQDCAAMGELFILVEDTAIDGPDSLDKSSVEEYVSTDDLKTILAAGPNGRVLQR